MNVRNKTYNTWPPIIHCQGWGHQPRINNRFFNQLHRRFFSKHPQKLDPIDNLTVFTWSTREKCLLQRSLNHLGLPCVLLGQYENNWTDSKKVPLLLEGLEKVTTPYVIAVDGFDAMVISDLKPAVEYFKESKADILFGAANGKCGLKSVYTVNEQIFRTHRLRHLCAGTVMGKTESLKTFYKTVLDAFPMVEKAIRRERGKIHRWVTRRCKRLDVTGEMRDDQTVIRAVALMFMRSRLQHTLSIFQSILEAFSGEPPPIVKLDHYCKVFANINHKTRYYEFEN